LGLNSMHGYSSGCQRLWQKRVKNIFFDLNSGQKKGCDRRVICRSWKVKKHWRGGEGIGTEGSNLHIGMLRGSETLIRSNKIKNG